MYINQLSCWILLLTAGVSHAGYTHYWTWKGTPDPAKVRKCVAEMKLILSASPVPLASIDGIGAPNILDNLVSFNMKGDDAEIGEPFVFPGRAGYNFCKTDGKDYDVVVTACLLVVLDHFNKDEVAITSDGKMSEDWADGIALYKKVLGRSPRLGKGATVSEFISNIDLKPKWDTSRLWIVFGLLGFGGLVAWFIFNPRPDFTIYFEREGNAYVKGVFPEAYANAVRVFFKSELPMKRNALVRGWNENGGRFRLGFAGPISDREQQRIRNFFAMLRKV